MAGEANKNFHQELRTLLDEFVDDVYRVTRKFPRDELFGSTSQLRRAALSTALNYIEGYARQRKAVLKQFVETAYGSLQEARYIIDFALRQQYILRADYEGLIGQADRIGKMFWGILRRLD